MPEGLKGKSYLPGIVRVPEIRCRVLKIAEICVIGANTLSLMVPEINRHYRE
jgi:hypothetical protein